MDLKTFYLKQLTRLTLNILFIEEVIKKNSDRIYLTNTLKSDIRELTRQKNEIKLNLEYEYLKTAIKNR